MTRSQSSLSSRHLLGELREPCVPQERLESRRRALRSRHELLEGCAFAPYLFRVLNSLDGERFEPGRRTPRASSSAPGALSRRPWRVPAAPCGCLLPPVAPSTPRRVVRASRARAAWQRRHRPGPRTAHARASVAQPCTVATSSSSCTNTGGRCRFVVPTSQLREKIHGFSRSPTRARQQRLYRTFPPTPAPHEPAGPESAVRWAVTIAHCGLPLSWAKEHSCHRSMPHAWLASS